MMKNLAKNCGILKVHYSDSMVVFSLYFRHSFLLILKFWLILLCSFVLYFPFFVTFNLTCVRPQLKCGASSAVKGEAQGSIRYTFIIIIIIIIIVFIFITKNRNSSKVQALC